MPARRKQSLLHGSAKFSYTIWHREHRSKKNRKKINKQALEFTKAYKKKKELLLIEELDQENEIYG